MCWADLKWSLFPCLSPREFLQFLQVKLIRMVNLPKSVLLGASNSGDSFCLASSNSPALAASKLRVQTQSSSLCFQQLCSRFSTLCCDFWVLPFQQIAADSLFCSLMSLIVSNIWVNTLIVQLFFLLQVYKLDFQALDLSYSKKPLPWSAGLHLESILKSLTITFLALISYNHIPCLDLKVPTRISSVSFINMHACMYALIHYISNTLYMYVYY